MSMSQRRGSLSADGLALSTQRRASVPQGAASSISPTPGRRGSKLTFLGAGRRVSMLVKYRQALQAGRKQAAVPEDEAEENPMEPIRELPQSPRFSTFLSAEAQFAMMKGYEDKLYEKIADTNPEVRPTLHRTKTPFQKISIADQEKGLQGGDVGREEEEEGEEGERGGDSPELKSTSSVTSSSGYSTLTPASTRTLSISTSSSSTAVDRSSSRPLDNRSVSTDSPTPSTTTISVPYLRPLRRQSVASSVDVNGNGMMSMMSPLTGSMEDLHLQRSNSLPGLDPPGGVSHNKRLVMTYRLESAMDLLDSMKRDDTEHSLSPRVARGHNNTHHSNLQGDVVRNFNSWTQVWNKEFKEIQTK
ncbi:uncharacterized protein LOC143284231 [Babylonia areolata]|uniref:uncharacterized protein LOC143284231 n=1 Tax=Babylonia areolata TaxID=304850 RepID=UPI003FD5F1BC